MLLGRRFLCSVAWNSNASDDLFVVVARNREPENLKVYKFYLALSTCRYRGLPVASTTTRTSS